MRIAVDARIFLTDEAHAHFIKEVFHKLAQKHPHHEFLFLSDKKIDTSFQNITPVTITPAPSNIFLYKWWFDVKIPLALKKFKADVFICTSGLCSVTTSIPQLLIVPDLAFSNRHGVFSKSSSFYKIYTSQFLRKATAIATFSDFIKKEVTDTYTIPEQKISVIDVAADDSFKPPDWEEREKIKKQYAQECEYFIYTASINSKNNLVNLLKAFSIFKKRQKTNLKLGIAVKSSADTDQLEKLSSYKYRNEIFVAENLSKQELANVVAGAYAMISTSGYEGSGFSVLEAMLCEVPVITSPRSSMSEIAGEAALYADAESPEQIAEQMKRIFKDEDLRNKLVAAGQERVGLYNWDKTMYVTWQLIQNCVSK